MTLTPLTIAIIIVAILTLVWYINKLRGKIAIKEMESKLSDIKKEDEDASKKNTDANTEYERYKHELDATLERLGFGKKRPPSDSEGN